MVDPGAALRPVSVLLLSHRRLVEGGPQLALVTKQLHSLTQQQQCKQQQQQGRRDNMSRQVYSCRLAAHCASRSAAAVTVKYDEHGSTNVSSVGVMLVSDWTWLMVTLHKSDRVCQ
jgi:hypothetical protein